MKLNLPFVKACLVFNAFYLKIAAFIFANDLGLHEFSFDLK